MGKEIACQTFEKVAIFPETIVASGQTFFTFNPIDDDQRI